MSTTVVVTGTDTDIGKTVFCAGLVGLLDGAYWKPVQSGLDGPTDAETVRRLAELPPERILPERYRLRTPASPHWSAEIDGTVIDPAKLDPPPSARPLIIEGAGGLMVPLTRDTLLIDVFARWRRPTVLCARTALGTINHTLLSIEALRHREIPLLGVAFIGDPAPENERVIAALGAVRVLGRLPRLEPLTSAALRAAFARTFRPEEFLCGEPR
jgi:dethiobiotin synthetase